MKTDTMEVNDIEKPKEKPVRSKKSKEKKGRAPKELIRRGLADGTERLKVQTRETTQGGRNEDDYGGDRLVDTAAGIPAQALQVQQGIRQLIRQKVEKDQENARLRAEAAETPQPEQLSETPAPDMPLETVSETRIEILPETSVDIPLTEPVPELPVSAPAEMPLHIAADNSFLPSAPASLGIPPSGDAPGRTSPEGPFQAKTLASMEPEPRAESSERSAEIPDRVPAEAPSETPSTPPAEQKSLELHPQKTADLAMEKDLTIVEKPAGQEFQPAVQTFYRPDRSSIPEGAVKTRPEGSTRSVKGKEPKMASTDKSKTVGRSEERLTVREKGTQTAAAEPTQAGKQQAIRSFIKEKQRKKENVGREDADRPDMEELPVQEPHAEQQSEPLSIKEKPAQAVWPDKGTAASFTDESSGRPPVKTREAVINSAGVHTCTASDHPAVKEKEAPVASGQYSKGSEDASSYLPVKEKDSYLAASDAGKRTEHPTIKERPSLAVSGVPEKAGKPGKIAGTRAKGSGEITSEHSIPLPIKEKNAYAAEPGAKERAAQHPDIKEKPLSAAPTQPGQTAGDRPNVSSVKEKSTCATAASTDKATERPAVKEKTPSGVSERLTGTASQTPGSLPTIKEKRTYFDGGGVGESTIIKEKPAEVVSEKTGQIKDWHAALPVKDKGVYVTASSEGAEPTVIREKTSPAISVRTAEPGGTSPVSSPIKEKETYVARTDSSAGAKSHPIKEKVPTNISVKPEGLPTSADPSMPLPIKEKQAYIAGTDTSDMGSPAVKEKVSPVTPENRMSEYPPIKEKNVYLASSGSDTDIQAEPERPAVKERSAPTIAEKPRTAPGKHQTSPPIREKHSPALPGRPRESTVCKPDFQETSPTTINMETTGSVGSAISPGKMTTPPGQIAGNGIKERPAHASTIKQKPESGLLIKVRGAEEPVDSNSFGVLPAEDNSVSAPPDIKTVPEKWFPKERDTVSQTTASPHTGATLGVSVDNSSTMVDSVPQAELSGRPQKGPRFSNKTHTFQNPKEEILPVESVREKAVRRDLPHQSVREKRGKAATPGRHPAAVPGKLKKREKPVKTAERTVEAVRTPVKTKTAAAQGAGQAMKAAAKTRKSRQIAAHTAQATKAAKTATEKGAKAVSKILKVLAENTRELLSALAAGGSAVIAPVLVICLVGLVIASPFGLFFAAENDDPNSSSVSSAVAVVKADYDAKLEELQTGSYDAIEISGEPPSWSDVLAVFAVKATGPGSGGMDVVTLDTDRVEFLTEVFWDMTEITSYVESIYHPDDDDDDYNDSWTEYILHINIAAKTVDEMRTEYGFTNYQNTALDKLLAAPDALNALVGNGLSIDDENMQEIVDSLPGTLSDKRELVVQNALSLVGKVTYFWGGKSSAIGWDDRWGTLKKVTASGNSTSGTYQPFGLDCSGFIGWCLINAGLPNDGNWFIGRNLTAVSQANAQPGDIAIFPDHSHVGLIVGRNDAGKLLVCHCSYSKNGVVVTEFSATGFTSIGKPYFYGD